MAETSKTGSKKAQKGKKAAQADGAEEEEVRLPVPDFEPEAYMKKEVESAKLAVLNTGYGILLASVAVVAQGLLGGQVRYGWFALLIGVAALRLMYRGAGVSAHEWSAKEWLAAYFTLFFTFLAFWYIFSNPPFVG